MTEERAKIVLQEQIEKYGQEYYAEGIEALEMAIKALEQESITWIVGKDNCQVAVKNMSIDKIQKICAIIKDEEQQPCEDWYDVPSDEMTFEQARQAVKDLRKKLAEYLEQQLCEDCVSREQALEAIDTWDKFGYTYTGCFVREPKGDYVPYVHYGDMVKCIKNLPSIKPQRPQGKWIEQNDTSKHHFGWYYCSNCGAYLMSADGANYCSCCGAEMEDSND